MRAKLKSGLRLLIIAQPPPIAPAIAIAIAKNNIGDHAGCRAGGARGSHRPLLAARAHHAAAPRAREKTQRVRETE